MSSRELFKFVTAAVAVAAADVGGQVLFFFSLIYNNFMLLTYDIIWQYLILMQGERSKVDAVL